MSGERVIDLMQALKDAMKESPAKVTPLARCTCSHQPTVPLRVFTATARLLREHIGQLPPELLTLPLLDVPCREKKCKQLVPVLVGDLLGYE